MIGLSVNVYTEKKGANDQTLCHRSEKFVT